MTANEVRRRFLEFFAARGHIICPSDSLIPPPDDKSLLFTGAGMNQFKDQFLGRVPLTFKRAATCQKCLRTGDIPNVGVTAFHQTFFEMLGNFSFGDYFKREAILWAWELSVKEFGLPPERLHASVHKDDEESAQIWLREVGIPPERFWRFGDKENFWPANAPREGPNGPCGPCSELFFDWGPGEGCGQPDCNPSHNCGRFVEYWNLVFTQFDRRDGGRLESLPQKNIDTGAGLERLTAIMQGVRTSYETDLFVPIVRAVCAAVGREPDRGSPEVRRVRRIADHVRAITFCISDGVLPSNQGRGYVLRKLIRQAVRDAIHLGRREPVLYSLVPVVVEVMREPYPELAERQQNIARILRGEEERFHRTLEQGAAIVEELAARARREGRDTIAGEEAFRLFDTYGFPIDVAETMLEESGLKVDRAGFERALEEQRQRARSATKISADIFGSGPLVELKSRGVATEFVGYEQAVAEGEVLGLVAGEDLVESADAGEEVIVILDRTNFYGEAGGQVGDTGRICDAAADAQTPGRFVAEVTATQRGEGMVLHLAKVVQGRVRVGQRVRCEPDVVRRRRIERNHTATHLLHHALREVLGQHAEQAGSLVAPDRLRFDFTHGEALTPEQIIQIEDRVNARILADEPVTTTVTTLDAARRAGAIALFGEKYGERVRMVAVGDFSRELCGGCHVRRTGEIGCFRIVSEQSVAAGIRRIEAVTGEAVLELARQKERVIDVLCGMLKAQEAKLLERVQQLQEQVRELRAEVRKAKQMGGTSAADFLAQAREVQGVRVVAAEIPDADRDQLRALADQLRQKGDVAAILASRQEKGVVLIVGLSKGLVERGLDAVKIARAAASILGGGGGGRSDLAQAGGQRADDTPAALEAAVNAIREGLA